MNMDQSALPLKYMLLAELCELIGKWYRVYLASRFTEKRFLSGHILIIPGFHGDLTPKLKL